VPVVTKIQQQKKRPDRYSVSIDGRFAFGLSDLDLSNSGLREGQELSEEQIERLKQLSASGKAYAAALGFLSFRPRSVWEVQQYLVRKEIDQATAEDTIKRLIEHNLVNDLEFARSWVDSRQLLKPRSKLVLAKELYAKRLDKEIIDQVLSEQGEDAELVAVTEVIKKKLTQKQYQDQSKLMAYLARQGFSYSLVKRALEELSVAGSE
jgi:regulatory protein